MDRTIGLTLRYGIRGVRQEAHEFSRRLGQGVSRPVAESLFPAMVSAMRRD